MMVSFEPKTTASVQPRWIFLIILLLWAAAARVWLVFNLPIRLLPSDVLEDGLFIRIAADPAPGIWLGKFNQFTLLKGPGYPFFLAVTSLSGLPVSATHALFQTMAISVTAWAVFRLTRSRASAAATFIALTFCPVGLALHRVLPDQIYWAQTLLVISLFAIILLTPPRRRSFAMIVAAVGGLVFGWTWLTAENSVWFIPALAFLTVGAIFTIRNDKDELLALLRNFCVAVAAFVALNVAFLAANLNAYGSPMGGGERYFTSNPTSALWPSLPNNLFGAVEAVWHPDLASTIPFCSISVENDDFKRYWTFLNHPYVKAVRPNREVVVLGWYYNDQSIEWPVFKAYSQDGQVIPSVVTRQASPDIQRHFSDQRAGYNRFELKIRSPDVCSIATQVSDGTELRIVLDPQQNLYAYSGSAQLNLDAVSDSAAGLVDPSEKFAASVNFSLIGLYEGMVPYLLTIGLIAAAAASWRAFSAQVLPAILLTALAAWLLVATRIVLLALSYAHALPAVTMHFSAPANYMAIVAACLSLTALSVGSRPENAASVFTS